MNHSKQDHSRSSIQYICRPRKGMILGALERRIASAQSPGWSNILLACCGTQKITKDVLRRSAPWYYLCLAAMAESQGDAQPHNKAEAPPTPAPVTKPATVEDDSDPDFDDLDGDIFCACCIPCAYLAVSAQMYSINSLLLTSHLHLNPMSNHNSPHLPRLGQEDPHHPERPRLRRLVS